MKLLQCTYQVSARICDQPKTNGLILASIVCLAPLAGQTVTVSPSRALRDEAVAIRATGLQPGEHVVFGAELADSDGQQWRSEAEFVADARGEVDVSAQSPIRGSYKSRSGSGLIWSMMPVDRKVTVYRAPRASEPERIEFQLVAGRSAIARAELERDRLGAAVRQLKLAGDLHGTLFLPSGDGPFPGVLVLGGSEGGLPQLHAGWLASHGYAALALAYFRYDGLPSQMAAIPLEYFGSAIAWLGQRPEILPSGIAVVGVSRGAELALQLASMFPAIRAVVAYAPSAVLHRSCCGETIAPYAWTWKNVPLPYAGNRQSFANLRAAIPVENTNGPVLLIAGEDDHVWDSAGMANEIAKRLKRKHFGHDVEVLCYHHAGHIAGRPEIVPEWHGPIIHPVSGKTIDYGGTPEGNAISSIDAISKVLEFLTRSLPHSRAPGGVF